MYTFDCWDWDCWVFGGAWVWVWDCDWDCDWDWLENKSKSFDWEWLVVTGWLVCSVLGPPKSKASKSFALVFAWGWGWLKFEALNWLFWFVLIWLGCPKKSSNPPDCWVCGGFCWLLVPVKSKPRISENIIIHCLVWISYPC